jgi:hypothetical protein
MLESDPIFFLDQQTSTHARPNLQIPLKMIVWECVSIVGVSHDSDDDVA